MLFFIFIEKAPLYSSDTVTNETNVEPSDRVVKVAGCESTGRGFESTLTPLVICVKALNMFSLKSTCSVSPSRINRYQLSWGLYH